VPHLTVIKPGWTLFFDMFYFVLFAIVLAFPPKRQLAAATVIFLLPLALHPLVRHSVSPVLDTYTNVRALSFLIGIWVAELYARRLTLPLWLAMACFPATIAGYMLMFTLRVEYHSLAVIPWIALAALSLISAVSLEAAGSTFCKLPYCTPIARWSYAIYLGQVFAIPIGYVFTPGPIPLKLAAACALSVALGAALNIWIEKPINDAMTRFEKRHLMAGSTKMAIAP